MTITNLITGPLDINKPVTRDNNLNILQQISTHDTYRKPLKTLTPEQEAKTPHISAEKLDKVQKIAEDFSAVFLKYMTNALLENVDENGPVESSHGKKIFQSMLADEFGVIIAKESPIKEQITTELLRLQEV